MEQDKDSWPHLNLSNTPELEVERRPRSIVSNSGSAVQPFSEWFTKKFSSYTQLIRSTAIWLRLMKTLQSPNENRQPRGFLTTAELREAENTVIREVQKETLTEEWKALSKGEPVSRKSPLRWYNPYICKENLIRIGGRLSNSSETEDVKHPAVLPARHEFTRMMMRYYHERLLHANTQLLLGTVRLKFWPLGGRSIARNVVHRCLKCFRSKPLPVHQFMGELPEARVTPSRPFLKTGVDYFGPVYVRIAPRRTTMKAYVAIFICMCTKAVHLELVTDLSTDRFLQALRRFVSRRGLCSDIYSDNGTNFVGAWNKLKELFEKMKREDYHDTISKECSKYGIQWHFNPPSAPHFGGLWEAAVRSAKKHLLKVIGENPTLIEDFTTLLVQVEGCLNSRPLTPLSDDPTDLEPLTPAHFLTGSSLQALPDMNAESIPMNRLNRWQLVQRRLGDFWKRWRREYICQLQGRNKRWKPPLKIDVDKLVVIHDDNQPPMRWKMGRIIEVHPGSDGIVRVVTLKTATGILKRPVEKICLLPIVDQDCNHALE